MTALKDKMVRCWDRLLSDVRVADGVVDGAADDDAVDGAVDDGDVHSCVHKEERPLTGVRQEQALDVLTSLKGQVLVHWVVSAVVVQE